MRKQSCDDQVTIPDFFHCQALLQGVIPERGVDEKQGRAFAMIASIDSLTPADEFEDICEGLPAKLEKVKLNLAEVWFDFQHLQLLLKPLSLPQNPKQDFLAKDCFSSWLPPFPLANGFEMITLFSPVSDDYPMGTASKHLIGQLPFDPLPKVFPLPSYSFHPL
jgi:hypothetical protein